MTEKKTLVNISVYFLKVFFPPKALSKMALYVQLTSRNATGPNLQNVALHSLCLSKEEPGDRGGAEAPSNPAEGKDRRSRRPGPDFIRSHCKFYLKLRRIHLFRKLCPHFSKKGKSRVLIFFFCRGLVAAEHLATRNGPRAWHCRHLLGVGGIAADSELFNGAQT